jgi:hypothetical protein
MPYKDKKLTNMDIGKVYEKIQSKGIELLHFGLPNVKSVSIETDNIYGIFINHKEIENSDEEFLVATHEYGHCMTGSTHPPYSSLDIISKHEYRADRKAVLDFLPVDRVKSAIENGCHSAYEFSEFLDVPEQFVLKAFQHYTAMGLI